MAHLGYIGLGEMGSSMVKCLLAAGHTVTGYNRTRSKADPLLELGLHWADSPRTVTEILRHHQVNCHQPTPKGRMAFWPQLETESKACFEKSQSKLWTPISAIFNSFETHPKDLNLAIELGQQLDVPLPTTATATEYMLAARGMGLGDYDFSTVFDVLARMSGLDTGR